MKTRLQRGGIAEKKTVSCFLVESFADMDLKEEELDEGRAAVCRKTDYFGNLTGL